MADSEPKKRGRRKKVVTDTDGEKKKEETTKRSKKAGKIVNALALTEMIQSKNINIILHLKCSIKQVDDYFQTVQWRNDNLTYIPSAPTEIQAFYDKPGGFSLITTEEEDIKPAYKDTDTNNFVCSQCNLNSKKTKISEIHSEEDLNNKLKELKLQFHKNEVDKKSACFWCTYPFDNDTCYILKHGSIGDIQGYGSFCSPECSVAYLYNNLNWDDSMKIESYQLINHYYGKPNNYQNNIILDHF